MNTKQAVLLVDDHAIVRAGCKAILTQHNHISVCGEAASGPRAIEQAKSLRPTVVVMDLNLPDLNGIETTRRLKAQAPNIRVVILSVHTDEVYVHRALEAGASAYVVKEGAVRELVEAVEAVSAGHMYLSPTISRVVVQSYLQRADYDPELEKQLLTSREQEVLQLVTTGLSTKEIAQRLQTSPRTIEAHRRNLMKKLNVHNTPELVAYALRHQLVLSDK